MSGNSGGRASSVRTRRGIGAWWALPPRALWDWRARSLPSPLRPRPTRRSRLLTLTMRLGFVRMSLSVPLVMNL
eukprot:9522210-Lingulodinium_polyedra.AAC.1